MAEVPFIEEKYLRSTIVNKLITSDDHSKVAFVLDIGNTEKLTAGIKDMVSNKLMAVNLRNVC